MATNFKIRRSVVLAGSTVTLHLNVKYLGGLLLKSIEAEIAALRIVTGAYADGSFVERCQPVPLSGFFQQGLGNLDSAEELSKQAIRSATISTFRQMTQFMDDVIAVGQLEGIDHCLTRDITNPDDQHDYMMELVEQRSHQVGTTRISSPRKYAQLVGDAGKHQSTADALFGLRAALEHHRQITKVDIKVVIASFGAWADGQVVEQGRNDKLSGGQTLSLELVERELVFPRGSTVTLTRNDVEAIAFTLVFRLAQEILQAQSGDFQDEVFKGTVTIIPREASV